VDRFARDPRTVLRRFEERVERENGVELLIGYEVEFMLLDSAMAEKPIDCP